MSAETVKARLIGGPQDGAEVTVLTPVPPAVTAGAGVPYEPAVYYYAGTKDGFAYFSCLRSVSLR